MKQTVAAGTFCEDINSVKQHCRGLRTGAYTEEFGNTGISDVSGSPATASSIDSSATGIGVIGTSLPVDGFPY